MSDDGNRSGGFWTSIPGVLTGVAALVTAVTGLYLALHQTPHPAPHDPRQSSETVPKQVRGADGFNGPMGPLERGVSYSGGDLYDRPASSAEQCVQLCRNDDRCRAITFIISQQRCWVKGSINPPQQSSDMISARKG